MQAKYVKGQKVRIVSVKNQHSHLKYPQFERYVNESGIIVESYVVRVEELNGAGHEEYLAGKYYVYEVRLDKGDAVVTVPEEILEAYIE